MLNLACSGACGLAYGKGPSTIKHHWSWYLGAVDAVTSPDFHGPGIRFTAGLTPPSLSKTNGPSNFGTVGYLRFYFQFDDLPTLETTLGALYSETGALTVGIDTSDRLFIDLLGDRATAQTITADTVYGVELEYNVSGDIHYGQWRTWSEAAGWVDRAGVEYDNFGPSTIDNADWLAVQAAVESSSGPLVYVYHVLGGLGTTGGEHYGESPRHSYIARYKVNGDGAHSFTSGEYKYNNSGDISPSATDVWSYLDEDNMMSTSDYIAGVSFPTGYLRFNFDAPASGDDPLSVAITATLRTASAAAASHKLRVSDDGTNFTDVFGAWSGSADALNNTAIASRHAILTSPPSGGSWTLAKLQSLFADWMAVDSIPAVFLDALSLEVEFPISDAPEPAPTRVMFIGGRA